MAKHISVRVSDETARALTAASKRTGRSQSQVAREALDSGLGHIVKPGDRGFDEGWRRGYADFIETIGEYCKNKK